MLKSAIVLLAGVTVAGIVVVVLAYGSAADTCVEVVLDIGGRRSLRMSLLDDVDADPSVVVVVEMLGESDSMGLDEIG
jgi:hypothetical protein